ncbi:hypothetical protein AB837_00259 [bacterium AB1]|nr:hypothetical protein AB837_00259 [bacterium AB1]
MNKKKKQKIKLENKLEVSEIKYNYVAIIRLNSYITISRSTYMSRTIESKDNKIVIVNKKGPEARYFYLDSDFKKLPAWLANTNSKVNNASSDQFNAKYSNFDLEI